MTNEMNIDIEATADLIMSARHSDAFTKEACVKILRDAQVQPESRGFDAHVIEITKKHPSWIKGNRHGATSLMAVAREFWDAATQAETQPKPESCNEIAREAWKEVTDLADTLEEGICDLGGDTRFIAIVLAAIERSHAAQPQHDATSSRSQLLLANFMIDELMPLPG